MPEFTVNPSRVDPYKHFKFRVMWDGVFIPGVTRVSGLLRRTEVVTNRTGSDPSGFHKSPGLTAYEPLVLERGRTHASEFEQWANLVWNRYQRPEVSLPSFRKDITVNLYNEADQLVLSWRVYRCWPSEYTALGDLDALVGCTAVERLVLQHEGWERDLSVTEPQEASAGGVAPKSLSFSDGAGVNVSPSLVSPNVINPKIAAETAADTPGTDKKKK